MDCAFLHRLKAFKGASDFSGAPRRVAEVYRRVSEDSRMLSEGSSEAIGGSQKALGVTRKALGRLSEASRKALGHSTSEGAEKKKATS